MKSLLVYFALLCAATSLSAQESWSYTDIHFNTVVLQHPEALPSRLDTAFFKSEVKGRHFGDATQQWRITIEAVKRRKSRFVYELKIYKFPEGGGIEAMLCHQNPYSYLLVTRKDEKGKLVLDKVQFLYGEI